MQNRIAAIAICLTEFAAVAPATAEIVAPPSRPARPEEMGQCKNWADSHVLTINPNNGNPEFGVLSCARAVVTKYDCPTLFKLASISENTRRIQGGALNEGQLEFEETRYANIGLVYENNCNFGS